MFHILLIGAWTKAFKNHVDKNAGTILTSNEVLNNHTAVYTGKQKISVSINTGQMELEALWTCRLLTFFFKRGAFSCPNIIEVCQPLDEITRNCNKIQKLK